MEKDSGVKIYFDVMERRLCTFAFEDTKRGNEQKEDQNNANANANQVGTGGKAPILQQQRTNFITSDVERVKIVQLVERIA